MVTKEYTYTKAFKNKRQRVKEREFQREVLLNALYKREPALGEIEQKQKAMGARLAMVTLSGDKAQIKSLKAEAKLLSAQKKEILKKAKIPTEGFDCNLCNDTGYVNGKICECIKREASRIMAEELSKEMPLGECRFDNFDLKFYADKTDENGANPKRRMTGILKLCREYVDNFNTASPSLLFRGDTGLGKTHLTLAIVAGVVDKGFMPIYGSAENLFSLVEAEKFSGGVRESYDSMLNCDLLAIDDLGAEMATSFTRSVLTNLINTRLLSGKPTIINTNLSMKEIENRYSPRIASRLIGNYDDNIFLGADIRQQKLFSK